VKPDISAASASSVVSVSVLTVPVNTNVGAVSATARDNVSVVTDSMNTVASALSAVTSLSVYYSALNKINRSNVNSCILKEYYIVVD
jgi:hypothetical protein